MNSIQYTRPRRKFGRQAIYTDHTETIFDEPANHICFENNYILQNPVNRSASSSKQFAISEIQTEKIKLIHRGMNHIEGGWPKGVDFLKEEQSIRHRKKIERTDNWAKQLMALTEVTLPSVEQNTAVNIYENYFEKHSSLALKNILKNVTIQVYQDLKYPSRSISQIDWACADEAQFLSVHSNFNVCQAPPPWDHINNEFYIWDCKNFLVPHIILKSPVLTTKAKFCPKNDTVIAGGFKNGMVAIWDSRIGGKPIAISFSEIQNQDTVTAICWVQSKSNLEFYTGSLDGKVLYWDGRNLKRPTFEINLDYSKTDDQSPNHAHGCTCLNFEYRIPVQYMAGTTEGQLIVGNRKATSHLQCIQGNFKVMDGPILGIERNVFFVKNFLIIGQFCAKIYCEECKDYPIIRFPKQRYELTCAVWSPTRYSLFVMGNRNGDVDFWDLLVDRKAPILNMNQFKSPISSLAFQKNGKCLAVGTEFGNVYMIQITEAYTENRSNNVVLLSEMFERELQRIKLMKGRVREINLAFQSSEAKTNINDIYPDPKLAEIDKQDESNVSVSLESFQEGEEVDEENAKLVNEQINEEHEIREKFRNIIETQVNQQKQKSFEFEITVFEGGSESSEFMKKIKDSLNKQNVN